MVNKFCLVWEDITIVWVSLPNMNPLEATEELPQVGYWVFNLKHYLFNPMLQGIILQILGSNLRFRILLCVYLNFCAHLHIYLL